MKNKNINIKKKATRKKNNYKRGDVLSVYLPLDLSDEALEWINTREFNGPAIIRVIEQVVSGELIPINYVRSIIDFNVTEPLDKNLLGSVKDKELSSSDINEDTLTKQAQVKKELDDKKTINKKKERSIPQFSFSPDIANAAKSIIDDD